MDEQEELIKRLQAAFAASWWEPPTEEQLKEKLEEAGLELVDVVVRCLDSGDSGS